MTETQNLEVPSDLLQSACMTMDDVRRELAVFFYQSERVSLGRAAAFAGVPLGRFLDILADHHISPHVGPDESLQDAAMLATLRAAK